MFPRVFTQTKCVLQLGVYNGHYINLIDKRSKKRILMELRNSRGSSREFVVRFRGTRTLIILSITVGISRVMQEMVIDLPTEEMNINVITHSIGS